MITSNPRIVLAGSVNSSGKTLEKLLEYEMNLVGVLGLDPSSSKNVSGYTDLGKYSIGENVKFQYFKKINSDKAVRFVRGCRPDVMFVVGLSQLVKEPLLSLPTFGCIGFHPTKLPKGRGRAAVAWLILGKAPGAATFFLMGEGMDDGPILAQKEFEIHEEDYAQDVIDKIMDKIDGCLDELLPKMQAGCIDPVPQKHSKATYLGKRKPVDGWIKWENSAKEIVRLVRAVSKPLPGAYSFINGRKITVERASLATTTNYVGVTGSILKKDRNKGLLVQGGDGLAWLHQVSGISIDDLRVGQKFGSLFEYRLNMLNIEIGKFKASQDG
jgi:methionyl-tRNA formyltransferase